MQKLLISMIVSLGILVAALSLPRIGGQSATLVAADVGDRLAIEAAARTLSSPDSSETALQEGTELTTHSALASPFEQNTTTTPKETVPPETTTTVAPTTSTTATTTTKAPTTTVAPTTTAAPETTAPAALSMTDAPGVVISERSIVLPVTEKHEDHWHVTTPCGNKHETGSGTYVNHVDVVLDPGHGGSESGAHGPAGALEKSLNLRISEIVEWYLEREGYTVLLTRTKDVRMPLQSRAAIANALDPKVFVSVHHNGGATRVQSTPGTEIFTDSGNPDSKRLGGLIFEELHDAMNAYDVDWVGTWRNGVGARLNDDGEDLYGIHRYTPGIPSVITEAGYLSNAEEEALFVDNDVQWAHGKAIAVGIMRYLRTSDSGSGYLDDFVDPGSSGTGGFDGCTDPAL